MAVLMTSQRRFRYCNTVGWPIQKSAQHMNSKFYPNDGRTKRLTADVVGESVGALLGEDEGGDDGFGVGLPDGDVEGCELIQMRRIDHG